MTVTSDGVARRRWESPWWTSLVLVLLIIGCDSLSMMMSAFLPAVQAARDKGRRAICANNLKQIASAMQSYHQAHGCFPPAFIPDENGKPKHSWRVLILPYLGETALYARYRFDEPWNGPHNMAMMARMPGFYRCPSDSTANRSLTNYAMIAGPCAISDGPTARRQGDIKDGAANSIMVAGTINAEIQWLDPRDLNTSDMVFSLNAFRDSPERGRSISSHHPGGAIAAFCDGTVCLIPDTVDEKTVNAMLTIDGGEAFDRRDVECECPSDRP